MTDKEFIEAIYELAFGHWETAFHHVPDKEDVPND
tara:strand:+ start:397 stop:501 length:105 start_codon:yes stop_codon:yes gene_type:complete